MAEHTHTTVSELVTALADGDETALDALFAHVYTELHGLAHRQRRGWPGQQTLNTTALVHETYLKLSAGKGLTLEGRAHFLALAARAMRYILINYAESRRTRKRGGALQQVSLADLEAAGGGNEQLVDGGVTVLLALDAALRDLQTVHERQLRVVECRFFGGLTVEETATALGVSQRTVKRDWSVAQAWLYNRLEGSA